MCAASCRRKKLTSRSSGKLVFRPKWQVCRGLMTSIDPSVEHFAKRDFRETANSDSCYNAFNIPATPLSRRADAQLGRVFIFSSRDSSRDKMSRAFKGTKETSRIRTRIRTFCPDSCKSRSHALSDLNLVLSVRLHRAAFASEPVNPRPRTLAGRFLPRQAALALRLSSRIMPRMVCPPTRSIASMIGAMGSFLRTGESAAGPCA